MIFSTLFKTKAKWQHKDATTRIAAINDELSTTNSEQQAILSMLIKEDCSDLVRRAALIKLACFDRYLEESKTNDQDKKSNQIDMFDQYKQQITILIQ